MKKFLKVLGIVLAVLLVAFAGCIVPIDRTPYPQMPYYQQEKNHLQQLATKPRPIPAAGLKAGWAKTNVTPAYPTPFAGYGNQHGKFEGVHDSLFARALVFDNGGLRVALVSVDLLIIPPTVTAQLRKKLPTIGFSLDRTYLSATHSHNSIGGWGENLVGSLFAGKYDQRIVDLITDCLIQAIVEAQRQLAPAQTGYDSIEAPRYLYNRLIGRKGTTDPFIRLLKIQKNTGQTAVLCTYAAHATCLGAEHRQLSRDYPGELVDALEKKDGRSVDFAVYMAGAVGSQGPYQKATLDDYQQARYLADKIDSRIESHLNGISLHSDSTLDILSAPLSLREPQWRLSQDWRLRPWLFSWLYGDYPSEMKALRIGNVVLVGTPCDFSGELVADFQAISRQKGVHVMITSFNGGYVGYITKDEHYDLDKYETRVMNWFGPYNAAYFEEVMKALIKII